MKPMKRPHCLHFTRLMNLFLNDESSLIINILYKSITSNVTSFDLLYIQSKFVEVMEEYTSLNDIRDYIHELEREGIIQNILQGEEGRVVSLFHLTNLGIEIKEILNAAERLIVFGVTE